MCCKDTRHLPLPVTKLIAPSGSIHPEDKPRYGATGLLADVEAIMAAEEPDARKVSMADIRKPGGLMTIAYLKRAELAKHRDAATLVSLRCLFCRERSLQTPMQISVGESVISMFLHLFV